MALINCPECGKEVSDQAPACIHCGFPLSKTNNIDIEKYIKNIESQFTKLRNVLINKYGETEMYQIIKENMDVINNNTLNANEVYDKIPLIILNNLQKNYAHINWPTCKRYFELVDFNNITENGFREFGEELKLRITTSLSVIVYWYPTYQFLNFAPDNCKDEIIEVLSSNVETINIFAQSHLNDDVTVIQETPPIKCPTCGSTNVSKISTAKKAVGFATVGVFSSNFGKTMECKKCGYKW